MPWIAVLMSCTRTLISCARTLIGVAVAALPLAMNAFTWDFETEPAACLVLEGAAPTAAPSLVVAGKRSLLADSRNSDESWNEFLRTRPEECPLAPETAYTVSLRYRAVEPLGAKVFYLLLRSEALGKEVGDRRGEMWESRDSEVHSKNFILRTGPAADYFLILGIRDRGALLIDDLAIRAGPDPPTGRNETFPFPFREEHARFERGARETGARAWVQTAQVVLDPVAWNPALDGDVRYLARLNPDFALYLNVHRPEVRELGFPRSGFSREYQELYHGDVKPGQTWEGLVQRYWTDGMARGIDGEPYMDSTWAEGGYFLCHASHRWHEDFLDETLAELARRQGIAQDNIGVPALWKGGFAFCPRCEERFRDELRSRYDDERLEGWGIAEMDAFSVRTFLLRHSLYGPRALRSPVVREYIKFYHRLQIAAWADCALRIRERAPRTPTPYLVNYGREADGDACLPVAGLRIGVRVPDAYRALPAVLVTPGTAEPIPLATTQDDDRIRVDIPDIRVYGIVVFGDMDRVRAKTEYADAVNCGARAACLGIEGTEAWWSELAELRRNGDLDAVRRRATVWQVEIRRREDAVLARLNGPRAPQR